MAAGEESTLGRVEDGGCRRVAVHLVYEAIGHDVLLRLVILNEIVGVDGRDGKVTGGRGRDDVTPEFEGDIVSWVYVADEVYRRASAAVGARLPGVFAHGEVQRDVTRTRSGEPKNDSPPLHLRQRPTADESGPTRGGVGAEVEDGDRHGDVAPGTEHGVRRRIGAHDHAQAGDEGAGVGAQFILPIVRDAVTVGVGVVGQRPRQRRCKHAPVVYHPGGLQLGRSVGGVHDPQQVLLVAETIGVSVVPIWTSPPL